MAMNIQRVIPLIAATFLVTACSGRSKNIEVPERKPPANTGAPVPDFVGPGGGGGGGSANAQPDITSQGSGGGAQPITGGGIATQPITSGGTVTQPITGGGIATQPITGGGIATQPITGGGTVTQPITGGGTATGNPGTTDVSITASIGGAGANPNPVVNNQQQLNIGWDGKSDRGNDRWVIETVQ